MYMTIPQFFSRTLTRFPDRTAIRNTREKPQEPPEVTYHELDQIASNLAVGLAKMGIVKGDRVAIMSRPRIRFAASLLAIKARQGRLAPHKRIRRKEDITLVDKPFPKTSTMDIKRHLYKGGNHVSNA